MYRKTYEIVGYAYDADLHCRACAAKRFDDRAYTYPTDFVVFDSEGNQPSPVTLGDCTEEEPCYCGDCFCNLAD